MTDAARPARFARWRTCAAGVLSGLLFALAFPPFGWAILVPLALVPWIAALAVEEKRFRALLSGVLFGLAFWCASLPWISYVVTNYGGQPRLMGAVCVVLLAVILCEWTAAVGWGTAAIAGPRSGRRLLVFPILWAAAEHARSVIYGGFPWNLTGWAIARRPVWTQTASVWGVYGLGFAAAAVASLLAATAVRRRAFFAAAAALLVLLVGGFGAARLSRSEKRGETGESLRVALIQPNLTEEDRKTPAGAAAGYEELVALGLEAARGADLVVFPESAFPMYWERSPRLQADLLRISRACGCSVLFNDVTTEPDGRVSNAARIVTPDGLAAGIYRKVHLVPFGEYVPLPKLFFFARQISQEIGEFSAAEEPIVLRSGRTAIGVGVCYEIIYPPLSRRQTSDGANLLATISVENGRDLVRAAITGVSGIVDWKGRIVAELPENRPGVLRGSVRLRTGLTAWTRWGHNVPLALDGAAVAVLLSGVARWLRAKKRTP